MFLNFDDVFIGKSRENFLLENKRTQVRNGDVNILNESL